MPALLACLALLALLSACADGRPTGTSVRQAHATHQPQAMRVIAALERERGMTFEPAGPHHSVGRAPDGVELDLVGAPVEAIVLSVPREDPEAGLPYLTHVRDLLHGPERVYEWVAAMLACRADAAQRCHERVEQGNLEARFSDGGPGHVVVTLSRGP